MNRTFMSMKFVDQDGNPVSRIFVETELIPPKKCSYYVYGQTSDMGNLSFSEGECRRAIDKANKDYPMDYAGRLEDICRVTVETESEKSLWERVKAVCDRDPALGKEFAGMMKGMTNAKYAPHRVSVDISSLLNSTIVLKKRK